MRKVVASVRRLITFSPVLTGVPALEDPWPGKSSAQVAESVWTDELATPAIPPEVWWPLLRAAWAYIDRFAQDILAERDRRQFEPVSGLPPQMDSDRELDDWLADPRTSIPLNARNRGEARRGEVNWRRASRIPTDGRTPVLFAAERRHGLKRRQRVLDWLAETGRSHIGPVREPYFAPPAGKRLANSDRVLREWLGNPDNLMFRHTMSITAAQEPDGEIALGLQLEHAARRAMANRTTLAYGKPDAKWVKEFDNQLQVAAAKKMVSLLQARRAGQTIAVGPGAARFHAGLDKVNDVMDQAGTLRAQVADKRLEITLLRDEFADLHLGTVNHCLWNAPTAECQNQLSRDQRGQAPLLGACQPSRCRNSVLTLAHEPIWRMEKADLLKLLKNKLSKPRREQALARLAEVRSATAQCDKMKENA